MRARHVAMAVAVAALWGFNFIAARLALGHIPPLLLAALRFAIAALPAAFLPRPRVAWRRMIAIASTLFIGQFAFLFCGMQAGMPPGLASVLTQLQAVVTMGLATLFLRETPRLRQAVGLAVATLGLACIGTTVGSDGVTASGLVLTLAAAASWAAGNVLLRDIGPVDMLPLVVWLSVIPPLPLMVFSLIFEGPTAVLGLLAPGGWIGALALVYIVVGATLVGYGMWGHLLKLYPASAVAPFALLVPAFGLFFASVTLGERLTGLRVSGIVLMALGLVLATLPLERWYAWLRQRRTWRDRAALNKG